MENENNRLVVATSPGRSLVFFDLETTGLGQSLDILATLLQPVVLLIYCSSLFGVPTFALATVYEEPRLARCLYTFNQRQRLRFFIIIRYNHVGQVIFISHSSEISLSWFWGPTRPANMHAFCVPTKQLSTYAEINRARFVYIF